MLTTSTGRGRRRPTKRLTFFADRSVGKGLPRALALLPWAHVLHMSEAYPNDGQRVEDKDWLARAGAEGWIVITQDARIWWNQDERAAVREHGVRVFCLGGQNYAVAARALVYGRHIFPLLRRANRPGACFWRLYPDKVIKDLR